MTGGYWGVVSLLAGFAIILVGVAFVLDYATPKQEDQNHDLMRVSAVISGLCFMAGSGLLFLAGRLTVSSA